MPTVVAKVKAKPKGKVKSPAPIPLAGTSFIEAMESPRIWGRWFKAPSWDTWRDIARAADGLPVQDEPRWFDIAAGAPPPTEAARELWMLGGRRGGKSLFTAARAVHIACSRDFRPYLPPGRRSKAMVLVVAATVDQALVIFNYIEDLIDGVPELAAQVVSRTKSEIHLKTRTVVRVATCSFRSIRGRTVACAIFDEAAFWFSDEHSKNADREILTAIRPSMATIPNSLLMVISSAYAKRGVMFDAIRRYLGHPDHGVLALRATTQQLHDTPEITGFLRGERERMSAAEYAAEYLSVFRDDLASFVSIETVEACVDRTRSGPIPWRQGRRLYAFLDAAGGTGKSSAALCIAFREGHTIYCSTWEWRPPFDPTEVVREIGEILRQYRLSGVTGDHWSGGTWPSMLWKLEKILYRHSKRDKSELLHDALPLLTSRQLSLPNNPRLINQFASLEQSTSRTGRDSIAAPPGGTEDLANVAAGAALMAAGVKLFEPEGDAERARQAAGQARPPSERVESCDRCMLSHRPGPCGVAALTKAERWARENPETVAAERFRAAVAVNPLPIEGDEAVREFTRRVQGKDVVFREMLDGRELMDRLVEPVSLNHQGFSTCPRCDLQYLDDGTGRHSCPRPWTRQDVLRDAGRDPHRDLRRDIQTPPAKPTSAPQDFRGGQLGRLIGQEN